MEPRDYIVVNNNSNGYVRRDVDNDKYVDVADRADATPMSRREAVEYLEITHGKQWQARASLIKLEGFKQWQAPASLIELGGFKR